MSNGNVFNHGIFIKLEDETYFLTASHCGVDLRGETFPVKWNGSPDDDSIVAQNVTFSNTLFFDPEYIKTGDRDICLLQVASGMPEDLREENVELAKKEQLSGGQMIEAQGSVHLVGRIVSVSGVSQSGFRMLVDGVSVPGFSGTPCFVTSGRLAGAIHGNTKHSGRLPDSATATVFVDAFMFSEYRPVEVKSDESFYLIKKAECYHGPARVESMGKGSTQQEEAIRNDAQLIVSLAGEVGYTCDESENENLAIAPAKCESQVLWERHGIWDKVMKVLSTKALENPADAAFPSLRTATSLRCLTPFGDEPVAAVAAEQEQGQAPREVPVAGPKNAPHIIQDTPTKGRK
ncbi:MAG: hypothetical protein SGILL_008606 [Bacillariaceae sp.]